MCRIRACGDGGGPRSRSGIKSPENARISGRLSRRLEGLVGDREVSASSTIDRVIFLKQGSLFSSMRSGDLRALAAVAEELVFEPGQWVVRENELGDSLYLIREGSMVVIKSVAGGKEVTLTSLSSGDCFGDMSIFDAEVRSASVKADQHCRLLRIGRDDMFDVLSEHPGIGVELIRIFVKRLRGANLQIERLSSAVVKGDDC